MSVSGLFVRGGWGGEGGLNIPMTLHGVQSSACRRSSCSIWLSGGGCCSIGRSAARCWAEAVAASLLAIGVVWCVGFFGAPGSVGSLRGA